jgi:hypothetical protein
LPHTGRQEARRSKETHEHIFFHTYYFNHPFVCRWPFFWPPNWTSWASDVEQHTRIYQEDDVSFQEKEHPLAAQAAFSRGAGRRFRCISNYTDSRLIVFECRSGSLYSNDSA